DLDRQRAEVRDQLGRGGEPVDVEDERRQNGGGDGADARDGRQVVVRRQRVVGVDQQVFQAFLPRAGVAQLAHLVADEFLHGRAALRRDGRPGVFQQRLDLVVGQIRDVAQGAGGSRGRARGGRVPVDELQDPPAGQILDEQRELWERESEQVMELVDEARALADDGLEAAGDLAQRPQLHGQGRVAAGPLGDGEACGGAGLHRGGLVAAKDGGAGVLVALRVAARHGQRRRPARAVEEVGQVVGVRAGGIEADDEDARAVAAGDLFEPLPELAVAGGRLGELEFGGGRLEIVAQEGGVVAVARRVDADAQAARRRGGWRSAVAEGRRRRG